MISIQAFRIVPEGGGGGRMMARQAARLRLAMRLSTACSRLGTASAAATCTPTANPAQQRWLHCCRRAVSGWVAVVFQGPLPMASLGPKRGLGVGVVGPSRTLRQAACAVTIIESW